MLRSAEAWNRVSAFASKVMKKKMDAEWRRKIHSRAMASSTPMYHPSNKEERSSEGEDNHLRTSSCQYFEGAVIAAAAAW